MSEPRSRAKSLREIIPGLYGWHVHDDRIDARSDAWALAEGPSVVLIDPLPLTSRARGSLDRLGRVVAICLTGSCHQRSAWRYRAQYAARVLAPVGSVGLEQEPDGFYGAGDPLPAGLRAIHTPGPTESHFCLLSPRRGGILFCADVLVHLERGRIRFVEGDYQDDPARTRQSARGLLDLDFKVLCPAHGPAMTAGAKRAVREALARDASR